MIKFYYIIYKMAYETMYYSYNPETYQNVNKLWYENCINEYIQIFNKDSKHFDKDLYETYETLIYHNISKNKELSKYIEPVLTKDPKYRFIIKKKPEYNKKLNYREIYFKIKPYKDKHCFDGVHSCRVVAFPIMFFILNGNVFNFIELFKYVSYEFSITNNYPYKIKHDYKYPYDVYNSKFLYLPKEYLDVDINLNKNVKFLFNYYFSDDAGDPKFENEYKFNIKFDKKPTFAKIIKYNTLIMLYTLQHLVLSFRNYNIKKDSVFNSETEGPGNNVPKKVMDFSIKLYKENYENLINDKIIRGQIYPQFIKQLENKKDNWFYINQLRCENYNYIFNHEDNSLWQVNIENIDTINNVLKSSFLLGLH